MSLYNSRRYKFNPDTFNESQAEPTSADNQANKDSDFWSFVGDIAPAAGSVIGGTIGGLAAGIPTGGAGAIPGIAAGATIGGGVGTIAGGMAHRAGTEANKGFVDKQYKEQDRVDRKMALLQALMAMRR